MPELGFARKDQICKVYKMIPCNLDSAHTLFISPTNNSGETAPKEVTMPDGQRLPRNQHLGNLFKEYIVLLEAMRLYNILINNSTFPLLNARPGDNRAVINTKIRKQLDTSHTLQAQMKLFKRAWEGNGARLSEYGGYAACGAQRMDDGITRNNTNIEQAMKMINDFDLKVRQLELRSKKVDTVSANIQRSRGINDTAPPAILSYNDVILMKPASKGRSDMSNKEWGRFKEEAQQLVFAIRMGAIPETNQSRLMGVILDDTL